MKKPGWLDKLLPTTKSDLKKILMKLNELNAFVADLGDKVDALNTEIVKVAAEVQALKDSLGNVDLPPDAQASLDRLSSAMATLTAGVKAVDDIIPDAPTP